MDERLAGTQRGREREIEGERGNLPVRRESMSGGWS